MSLLSEGAVGVGGINGVDPGEDISG